MLNALQPWHIIVLVIVLIALFGAKRLPDAARGIGKSMRIFKSEAKSLREENEEQRGEHREQSEPVTRQLEQGQPDQSRTMAQTHTETSQ